MMWPLQLQGFGEVTNAPAPTGSSSYGAERGGQGKGGSLGGHAEDGWASKKRLSLPRFSNICP